MDKVLYYNELFSCYGELLTKKEQELFSIYYEENLSMGEIAELKKVSRSGVGARIKRIEKKLEYYESIIHKYKIKQELKTFIKENHALDVSRLDSILQK